MEEIFRTVLEYASKATVQSKNVDGIDDEMTEPAVCERNACFMVEQQHVVNELPSTTSLPGCDQIMPQRPAVRRVNLKIFLKEEFILIFLRIGS